MHFCRTTFSIPGNAIKNQGIGINTQEFWEEPKSKPVNVISFAWELMTFREAYITYVKDKNFKDQGQVVKKQIKNQSKVTKI